MTKWCRQFILNVPAALLVLLIGRDYCRTHAVAFSWKRGSFGCNFISRTAVHQHKSERWSGGGLSTFARRSTFLEISTNLWLSEAKKRRKIAEEEVTSIGCNKNKNKRREKPLSERDGAIWEWDLHLMGSAEESCAAWELAVQVTGWSWKTFPCCFEREDITPKMLVEALNLVPPHKSSAPDTLLSLWAGALNWHMQELFPGLGFATAWSGNHSVEITNYFSVLCIN